VALVRERTIPTEQPPLVGEEKNKFFIQGTVSAAGIRAGRPRDRGSSCNRFRNFHFSILESTQPPIRWGKGTGGERGKAAGA
jgi:hypothetical protein